MVASTTVRIKNDTGDTVTFVTNHDYHGNIKAGTAYPKEIKKGETGVFVFENEKVNVNGESSGAVVYKGKNEKGDEFEWMYAWSNMDGADEATYKAYTDIASAPHYKRDTVWDDVRENLVKSGNRSSAKFTGCASDSSIGKSQEVAYEGHMNLYGV